MISYGAQYIDNSDIKAVVDVLKSDFITQGQKIPEFENKINKFVGSKFSVAFNSATSALISACMALDLKKDDIVWTSPISFVSSANCALICGAQINFIDINPNSFNIDADILEQKLKNTPKHKHPKLIIVVHFSGYPAELEKISKLSNIYGFKIIEDASHALGASFKKTMIGSNKFSDITVFSFHPVKMITTGEGGLALTNNAKLKDKLELYRTHGVTNKKKIMTKKPTNEIWNYQQISLGYNFRLNDFQAALGISQLKKLPRFLKKRQNLVNTYKTKLKSLPIYFQEAKADYVSSNHLFVINLSKDYEHLQKKIYKFLIKNGIGCNIHYIPIFLQPYYKNLSYDFFDCPNSINYFKRTLTLPLHFNLSKEEQMHVIDTLYKVF